MRAVVKTPDIEINIEGEIPEKVLKALNEEYGNKLQIIEELDKHSSLANINARPGDVIRKIDEITVNNTDDFKKAIIKYRWKESVVILLQRGDRGYYITLQL